MGPSPAAGQSGLFHPHGTLSSALECTLCHTAEAWTPTRPDSPFDHDRNTSFMLLGSHGELSCERCHRDFRFSATEAAAVSECGSCHLDVHQGKLGANCSSCHRPTTFADVPVTEIHARTFFPLTGVHLEVSCDVCHSNDLRGAFSGKDTACVECHRADYQRTSEPDHRAAGFDTRCEGCHGTLAWPGAGGLR